MAEKTSVLPIIAMSIDGALRNQFITTIVSRRISVFGLP